jgi:hypothetical protein
MHGQTPFHHAPNLFGWIMIVHSLLHVDLATTDSKFNRWSKVREVLFDTIRPEYNITGWGATSEKDRVKSVAFNIS